MFGQRLSADFAAGLVVTVGAPSDCSEKQAFTPDAIPRVRGQHFMLLRHVSWHFVV